VRIGRFLGLLKTNSYSGAPNFSGAQSGPASESVARASTAVVLVPHPVLKKKKLVTVGLTAEIQPQSPGGGTPTGTVAFELVTKKKKKTKTKVLGTAPLSDGQATLSFKSKRVLNTVITIIYSGDTDFHASTLTSPKLTQKAL
jgi:large repetitive protein